MAFEQAREYLARVVPWPQDDGEPFYVNVHWTFKGRGEKPGWSGRATRSVKEAVNAIEFALKSEDTRDVYVCMSAQREAEERLSGKGFKYLKPIRGQANAVSLRSLFLDVDVKDETKGYASIEDANAAVESFLAATGLPQPSMVVGSGGGMHVYWVLDRDLLPYEWEPLARALAEATKTHGLKCDTQCTIDSARILRIPDTQNRKLATPRPVSIAGTPTDFNYSVDRIAHSLAAYYVAPPVPALPPRAPLKGVNSELSAGVEERRAEKVDLKSVAGECAFIRDTIVTGGIHNSNPLWNLTTLIATFAENGKKLAHVMGMSHPDYALESTNELYERKEKERETKGLGWPSCKVISASGCHACGVCKHFSEGKSPLNFGIRKDANGAVVTPLVAPSVIAPTLGSLVTQDDLPNGYYREKDGIVAQLLTQDDGSTLKAPISLYPMVAPWLQRSPWVLHFTTTTERHKTQQISLPLEIVNTQEMRRALQSQGFMLRAKADRASEFFVTWIEQLQKTKDAVASSPFGWSVKNGNLEGFVFGGELWTPNGHSLAANPDTVVAKHYAPTGDTQSWTDAAKLILDQDRQDLAALIASAFGAPLVRFTGQPGVLMSAYSQESGIGKTTALKVAQAVWGDPVKAVQSLSDTQNAVMNKLGEIRSLPLYWDELKTEEDTRKFVNITFQTTQGKEKARMTASIKQREPGSWQTLLVSASNDSLLDYVLRQTNTTLAGLYRVFEFIVEPPLAGSPGQLDTSVASRIIAKLHDNYGSIGLEYSKFLGANHARIDKEMSEFLKELGDEVDTTPDERFWLALIACVCVGARYANELRYANFNEDALRKFMLKGLENMRGEKTAQPVDLSEAINVSNKLAQFLNEMRVRNTLTTNIIHNGRGKPQAGTVKILGDINRLDSIAVHVGADSKTMRISHSRLCDWLTEHKLSRHIFIKALHDEFGASRVNGRIASGTMYAGMTEHLIEIDLTKTTFANFIDEA